MNLINQFNQPLDNLVENWIPRQQLAKDIIRGKYCILEPIEIDKHANKLFDVFNIGNRGESWTYLPYGPFVTVNDFKDWLKKKILESDTVLYAIFDGNTQQPIGISAYMRINPEHGVAEIGHLHFSTLLKQTRLATEAIYLMLRNIFEAYEYRRCEWKCNNLNAASKKAAERFGFKFEGIFRQHAVYKNHNRDTAWFSIIDAEWPALKAKYEKWLHPDNFSLSGKQILKFSEI